MTIDIANLRKLLDAANAPSDAAGTEADFYCKGCEKLLTRCQCAELAFEELPALLDELERLHAERQRLAIFLIRYGEACSAHDWACAKCRPESDCLVDGFVCALHEAKAIAAEQRAGGAL